MHENRPASNLRCNGLSDLLMDDIMTSWVIAVFSAGASLTSGKMTEGHPSGEKDVVNRFIKMLALIYDCRLIKYKL